MTNQEALGSTHAVVAALSAVGRGGQIVRLLKHALKISVLRSTTASVHLLHLDLIFVGARVVAVRVQLSEVHFFSRFVAPNRR